LKRDGLGRQVSSFGTEFFAGDCLLESQWP